MGHGPLTNTVITNAIIINVTIITNTIIINVTITNVTIIIISAPPPQFVNFFLTKYVAQYL